MAAEAELERLRAANAQLRQRAGLPADATLVISVTLPERKTYYDTHNPLAGFGKAYATLLNTAITYECGCRQYADVLTIGRWRALGYYIRRGEHADYDKRAGRQKTIPLFCRCQINSAATDAPAQEDRRNLAPDELAAMGATAEQMAPIAIDTIPGF